MARIFAFARGRPEDVLPFVEAGLSKYKRPGEDRRRAARFLLAQAVALFARHAGPAEAALVCAEAVATAHRSERVALRAGREADNVHRLG